MNGLNVQSLKQNVLLKTDLKKPIAKVEPLDPNESNKQNNLAIGVLANGGGIKRSAVPNQKTTPMATATKLIKTEPRVDSPKINENNKKDNNNQSNNESTKNKNEIKTNVKNEPMEVLRGTENEQNLDSENEGKNLFFLNRKFIFFDKIFYQFIKKFNNKF